MAACGNNADLLIVGRTGAIVAAHKLVVDSLRKLRLALNPDGMTASPWMQRLYLPLVDADNTLDVAETATTVYGDDRNIREGDIRDDAKPAILALRERADSLFAHVSGSAPPGSLLDLGMWLTSFRAAVETLERKHGLRCRVTLQQVAPLVHRSKRTLERWKQEGELPKPEVQGGGRGNADYWRWDELRPALETKTGISLPTRFPADLTHSALE